MQVLTDFKHRFSTDRYFKFRTITVLLSLLFGFFAFWLGLSFISALSGTGFFLVGIGRFFTRSFGFLAMFIPLYFCYAAYILADPKWRPDRIFYLNSFIFPFLTLAIGFAFTRDFEIRAAQFALLDFTGKTGFNLLIIFITVIEVILLFYLKNVLFPEGSRMRRYKNYLPPPEVCEEETQLQSEPDSQAELQPQPETTAVVVYEKPVVAFTDESDIVLQTSSVMGGGDSEVEELMELDDEDTSKPEDKFSRALEEAEAAAAAHGEQIRKKNTHAGSSRYKKYKVPIDILNEYPDGEYWIIDQVTRDAAVALKETLEEFKIQAEVTGIRKGPVITMFEILPAPGVKLSRIVGLQDNIALRLAASSVRIVAPIPGKHAVGIEVPNAKRNIVSFKEIIEGELQKPGDKMGIPVVMGKDITGEAQTVDLVQMPHLLIAGATGSGKSVCVNAIILSILYQLHPNECRLMLIDPKIVELKLYNDIPHLLTPVITESKKAFQALQYCIYEMERRYACLDSMGVRDIRSYNKRIKEKNIAQEHMPYIVVIIDEFADLMSTTGKELESTVARLAAMSRAVGIHLVLATQRPSIDVITGLIKANIPSRIAFMVASKTDSRIIIDMVGAEKLLGKGDMLYSGVVDPFPIRMQGAFISEEEVEAVVEHVKTFGEPEYIDDEIFFEDEEDDNGASLFSEGGDPLYEKALEIVMQQGKASASYIQRRLKIGFNRAARIIDEMEYLGVVGPAHGSKPRELLRGISA
ncbi:MAG: FtsK/SpoIIIE domain-containing protein [Treponema sp.]|nr:FtsK/SpoIIIE domain-containing protein [Treponema sp.]